MKTANWRNFNLLLLYRSSRISGAEVEFLLTFCME